MRSAALATTLIAAAPAVAAQSLLDGDAIRAAVANRTIAGGMLDRGPYTEFHGAGGEIRGDGCTGTWTVEGDAMRFDHGEGPDCRSVGRDGETILWIEDAEVLGTGEATAGEVNGF